VYAAKAAIARSDRTGCVRLGGDHFNGAAIDIRDQTSSVLCDVELGDEM
jgi:hypothetical protein